MPLWLLRPARADWLGAQAASPPGWSVSGAGIVAIAIAAAALGMRALPLLGIALISAAIVTVLARRHLQGHTGDVLGACALASETACLLLASAGWF
jgi:adenosylcobinamide-GDP ribazoletransferase